MTVRNRVQTTVWKKKQNSCMSMTLRIDLKNLNVVKINGKVNINLEESLKHGLEIETW